jgi:AraC-like DNA-binding protein
MWREVFGRRLLRVDLEPLSDLPFHAQATLRALPGLRTVACTGSALGFQRTRAIAADDEGSISMIVNLGESCNASQRGREVALGAGDAVAVLHHEPAAVTFAAGTYVGLFVPRPALARRVHNIDDATLRLISHRTEALRLLVSYLTSVREELALGSPKLRRVVVSHIHDLIALALAPHGAVDESGLSAVRAARLAAILKSIAERFQEPELGVAAVARSQRISPRYLQGLLEKAGASFTARLNELRLQEAFRLLTAPRESPRRISDIALQVGFSDISHFNRLFRSRFGDTPSGVRGEGRRVPL